MKSLFEEHGGNCMRDNYNGTKFLKGGGADGFRPRY